MSDPAVSKIILEQMGGLGRIARMIGGNSFAYTDKTLRFSWKARSKSNQVLVTLRPDDTYDVEFFRLGRKTHKLITKYEGIYCDGLIEVFETETKLYLRF